MIDFSSGKHFIKQQGGPSCHCTSVTEGMKKNWSQEAK